MMRWMTVSTMPPKNPEMPPSTTPSDQADRHADEPDRHRDLRREEEARVDIAALHVGAEEEERLVRARALEAEEVDVGGDEPEELVVEARAKSRSSYFLLRILDDRRA